MDRVFNKMEQALSDELKTSEKVIWSDQPIALQLMLPAFGIWVFMIPWTLFASSFFIENLNKSEFEVIILLVISFFLFVGVTGLLSPFYIWLKAKKTLYVVTNQRVFIVHYLYTLEIQNIDISQINNLVKKIKRNASGDLILCKEYYWDSYNKRREKERGFFAVNNVSDVEKHVLKLVEQHHRLRETYIEGIEKLDNSSSKLLDKSIEAGIEPMTNKQSEIEKQLVFLFSRFSDSNGSRRYVLQERIVSLLEQKRTLGYAYSKRDVKFLAETKTNSNSYKLEFFDNPDYFGIAAVVVVVLLLIFKSELV